ncbi:MAG: DUF2029 domain-containing protein, partial [Rhodospirillales bacterium]|nr:DUF2029 domain-containing protein [Rhodospirillales bacterium]
ACVMIRYLPPWQASDQWLMHTDFARMWYVGRDLLAGLHLAPNPASLPGGNILTSADPRGGQWLYPPPTGLVAMAFAWPSPAWAFWGWRISCILLGYGMMRLAGLPRFAVIMGLAGPAALLDLSGGQMGTLTGSLLVTALMLAERCPKIAGISAGVLVIKPQVALVVPFAWARARFKNAYLAAAVTVLAMLLASLVFEGKGAWLRYFNVGLPASWATSKAALLQAVPAQGFTVSYLLRSLGAPLPLASFGQDIASALAIGIVWFAWKAGRIENLPRMILTVCLSLLATPYGYAYSLVGFSVAMMVLVTNLNGWPAFLAALLWLMGGYTMTIHSLTGLFVFPFCAVAGAALAWRFRHEPTLQ